MSPFARAHSRLNATSLARATRSMWGVEDGEPISSSGLAMTVRRSNGSGPRRRRERRLQAVEQRQQARLHVGDARAPWRCRRAIAKGRAAAVPSGKTVSMWPTSSARGPPGLAVEDGLHGVAEDAVGVGVAGHLAAEARQERGHPRRHLVHAVAGVAPAVQVDETLEVGEEGRLGGLEAGAEGGELGGRDEDGAEGGRHGAESSPASRARWAARPRVARYPPRTVRLVEIRLLEGPNLYRLEPAVKVEVAVGAEEAWHGERDAAEGVATRLWANVPPSRRPADVARLAGWCGRLRVEAGQGAGRRGPRPPRRRSRPLDRLVPVARRRAGPDPRRGRLAAGRRGAPRSRGRPSGHPDVVAAGLADLRRHRPRPGDDPRRERGGSRSSPSPARTARAP